LLDSAAIDIPRYGELENGRGMAAAYELAFGNEAASRRDASPPQHIAPGKHVPPKLLFYAGDRTSSTRAVTTARRRHARTITPRGTSRGR
jgi:hypothetical protein